MSERNNGGVYEKGPQDTNFRRTWDKSEYERRARERSRKEREHEEDEDRKRKGQKPKHTDSSVTVEPPRELLKARTEKVVLDTNLNKTQVVQSTSVASKQPGFYCKECDCVVKDSVNFLDHINGKKHQRALGMSMKVERSTAEQIRNKLAKVNQKKEGHQEYDLDARIEQLQKEEEEEKRRRKERKKKKKAELSKESDKNDFEDVDPELKKLMGFSGFS